MHSNITSRDTLFRRINKKTEEKIVKIQIGIYLNFKWGSMIIIKKKLSIY